MARRVELGQAIAPVLRLLRRLHLRQLARLGQAQAQAAQHPGQLLNVALGVAAVHAQRVQLQQLARVVLVQAPGGAGLVVEIAQHRRLEGGGLQQVLEAAERALAQRLLMVADQRPQIGLGRGDAEMVAPEPGHALAHPVRRVQRQQQRAVDRLAMQLVEPAVGSLPVLAAAQLLDLLQPRQRTHRHDRHRLQPRLHRCGQAFAGRGPQQAGDHAAAPALVPAQRGSGIDAPAQPVGAGTLGRRQPRRRPRPARGRRGTAGQHQRARTRAQALAQEQTPDRILSF